MSIVLPALAVAFAAFCVWLGVRIFNRGERWAKWTLAGLVVLLAYPLSFGPFLWLSDKMHFSETVFESSKVFYAPVIWAWLDGPEWISYPFQQYTMLWWQPQMPRIPID